MKEMVGIKEVALKAGVSIATVSNVLNCTKPVSKELQDKVHHAVEELQYQVNPVARGLKSNKTNQVGIIVSSFNQVYFSAILQGVHEAGIKLGYNVSVFETNGKLELEKRHVKYLQNAWADGIILSSYANTDNSSDQKYIKSLAVSANKKKKIPIISLENILDPGIDSVIIDNKKAAGTAVGHLIAQGHEKIAHITAPMQSQIGKLRLQGFCEALKNAGLSIEQELISEGNFTPISGFRCMKGLIETKKPFTAVFTANDQMGIGAIRALHESGYRIPEDVAVIGIDNNFPSTLITPSLSTVSIPKYEMGYQAMSLLAGRLKAPEKPRCVITLDTELIVRKSTTAKGDDAWYLLNW